MPTRQKCSGCGKRIELAAGPAEKHGVEQGAWADCVSGKRDAEGNVRMFHPSCKDPLAPAAKKKKRDPQATYRRRVIDRAIADDEADRARAEAAMVEALAAGAPAKKRSGPNIPENDRRTVAVKLRLSREAADELRALAEHNEMTLSALVAELARHELAKLDKPPVTNGSRHNEDSIRLARERGAEAGRSWADEGGDDAKIVNVARQRSTKIGDEHERRAWFRGFVDAANETFGI